MSNLNEPIAQWEKMTREVPDDMSWSSLGSAYREAGRLEEADRAFAEAIRLNPAMSVAYQLRAQVLIQLGHEAQAAEVLTLGYTHAARRGEMKPMKAMESLLQKLGQPVPQVASSAPTVAVDPNNPNAILDRRSGKPGTRLERPPLRGPVGELIQASFSRETWQEWIRQGTKVINELRLDFSRPDHMKTYDQHMMEWLGISQEEVDAFGKK